LGEGDGAIGVAGKASAEVILKVPIIGEVEFRLEGCNFGGNEGGVRAEKTGVSDIEDKVKVLLRVEAGVDSGGEPAASDKASV